MALSWNEIKERAVRFSKEWSDVSNENADAKPFLVEFFNVFGISRKKVATFEHRVKKIDDKDGYIDLFWKGTLLIEMKSAGKNLSKAYEQARAYLHQIPQVELPKYILVSDFTTFRLYDLEEETHHEFALAKLVDNVQFFGFIAGYQQRTYKEQDPVNIDAAELMGKLHDRLKIVGYQGHPLEVYLVRLLFCLFADDTTIFDRDIFHDFINEKTSEDGSDLAARLNELFYILNTPKENRLKNIDEHLAAFPYVNGNLFKETLPPAAFDAEMRRILLESCYLDWGKISPAIFGSMFQSVMNPKERRNLGAHYTSEKNILKLIKQLFLDDLIKEFESVKGSKSKMLDFHSRLSKLKFFDPACGCGNFLIITYRELRKLEIEILRELNKTGQGVLNIGELVWLDVDMMYGIEYEEFPARIAEVAMWLIDHQMNMAVSAEFGQYFVRLPLRKSATIIHGNALELEWEKICPKNEMSYILGNPPFIGSKLMSTKQRNEINSVFDNIKGAGVLDYVSGWYAKAAKYINGTKIKVAFVSTNSIVQGEQANILWDVLFRKYGVIVHFAHRTFKWANEAKGNAAVFCVIVGFANYDINNKVIFEYEDVKGEPHELKVKNINAYLVDARNVLLTKRRLPICDVPEISFGSMPNDGGNFLLDDNQKAEMISREPGAKAYIKPLLSAHEFLNGHNRWCIWLDGIKPNDLKGLKEIAHRVENVRRIRSESTREATKKLAAFPQLFGEIRQPSNDYILIPRHSSENRKYIPLGYFSADHIVSDSCLAVENATLYHFGILHSEMHMAWVRNTCGRIKSDFRYSNEIVYNNYPWPVNPSDKNRSAVENAAQKILLIRAEFPDTTLSNLYDPSLMPVKLTKAHQELDKAVDLAYRPQPFTSESNRMMFLFELYEQYIGGLFSNKKKK
ncbi:SAM-dependent methyltransferase [Chitinophagaceae bacterium IBVUCB1]|nr:SAM-dependent methyltransferase [Chitinophagaceae bacterium IBVUCB1]